MDTLIVVPFLVRYHDVHWIWILYIAFYSLGTTCNDEFIVWIVQNTTMCHSCFTIQVRLSPDMIRLSSTAFFLLWIVHALMLWNETNTNRMLIQSVNGVSLLHKPSQRKREKLRGRLVKSSQFYLYSPQPLMCTCSHKWHSHLITLIVRSLASIYLCVHGWLRCKNF